MQIPVFADFEWTLETMWPILLAFGALLFLAIFLFLYTGFIMVKKNKIAVIERIGLYVETTKKTKYYTPLLYRRAGYYKTGPQKSIVKLPNGNRVLIIFEIINVVLFHYSGHNIERQIENAYTSEEIVTFEIIKNQLSRVGINLINIEQVNSQN